MIEIEVNNRQIQAEDGEMLLDAMQRAGVTVPTLCHIKDLFPSGACRMCVVEVEGARNLLPSCATPVTEGMKVKTHSSRALRARKTIVELLLANHPDDCLYCVRSDNCELRGLSSELGVEGRRYRGDKSKHKLDVSSPSIVRDPEKCILCGKCVRVCEEVQGVSAIDFTRRGSETYVTTAFDEGLNVSSCVFCGQCVMACPTGALRERDYLKEVMAALNDPDTFCVVQHAPSVSVSLGEEFGLPAGTDVDGWMVAALRRAGFDRVFDTSFTADLTIMEEASELAHRIANGGVLPMMTSCSPGWVKFVETFYPEMMPNLSSCKSPQGMLGAIVKHIMPKQLGIDPKKIFSVSVMPCTAKKFEANRPELGEHATPDVDAVLTTRELARLIRHRGLNVDTLEPDVADDPFGERTTAGKLFGATGGVMEAAVRTAHYLLTGEELAELRLQAIRGLDGVKEASLKIGDLDVNIAVISGLGNARKYLEDVKKGRRNPHFIEVMTCPGGCINGGGQPRAMDRKALMSRLEALYSIDKRERVRVSHKNTTLKQLYDEHLGQPLGEVSHKLLHTHYAKREVLK